ncbi:MAG: hypothetical protein ACRAVC_24230 [Trichormus sp.]
MGIHSLKIALPEKLANERVPLELLPTDTLVKKLVIIATKLVITNIKMVVSPGFAFYRTNCILQRSWVSLTLPKQVIGRDCAQHSLFNKPNSNQRKLKASPKKMLCQNYPHRKIVVTYPEIINCIELLTSYDFLCSGDWQKLN